MRTTNVDAIRRAIVACDFHHLFIEELGWDNAREELSVQVGGQTHTLRAVAKKAGHVAYLCEEAPLPAYPQRVAIERELTKLRAQHLIIFVDGRQQIWQHAQRVLGEQHLVRVRYFEHPYFQGQDGGALAVRVQSLVIDLAEEDRITGLGVEEKKQAALTVERVTKKFYNEFEAQHRVFTGQIVGLEADEEVRKWYASLMLNRLMFAYFIQRKGFLGGDHDYLRHKLDQCINAGEDGAFFRYYQAFLLKFFHEGLGRKPTERRLTDAESAMLGDVPYLNGGLFELHDIEKRYETTLDIPNAAFVGVFALFDKYDWTLDTRQKANDREINPDILGYIFEKFVNRKQMGAYYTKEDITDYISKNTIIPFLFDAAQSEDRIAFAPTGNVWRLLREEPDRYLYDAVRQGVIDEQGAIIPLPDEIAAGIATVSARGGWNRPATAPFALPTETWREHVARRQRCLEVREKLAAGEVTTINDLITYNLNISLFARDVIQQSDGPDLVNALYKSITRITVLDPTCGSGAFLFAALNLLAPLYEACLDRMQTFVEADDARMERDHTTRPRQEWMRETLTLATRHLSREYFILKSIIIQNLFGVDIMHEAVEIAKLRLFLKLVAQVNTVDRLEPLPDIDFNIRAGNTLVGYATYAEVEQAVKSRLDFDNTMARIDEKAEQFARALDRFREQQTTLGGSITAADKADLHTRQAALGAELDRYLATEYGVEPTNATALEAWRTSHQPFHWYAEFYAIMKAGGFDVIIGNPPWREYAAVKKEYRVQKYQTEGSGNLYALCIERTIQLRNQQARTSFIVQLPLVSSSRMSLVRKLLNRASKSLFIIPFDDRPGKLFEGLEHCRSAIYLSESASEDVTTNIYVTKYQRWPTENRPNLISTLEYVHLPVHRKLMFSDQYPKHANKYSVDSLEYLTEHSPIHLGKMLDIQKTGNFIYYQEATQYWVKAIVGLPYYAKNGKVDSPAHGRFLHFKTPEIANVACAILNSNLFYMYFISYGDCFHLSERLVFNFPISEDILYDDDLLKLSGLLQVQIRKNPEKTKIKTKEGDLIEYDEYYARKSKPIIDEIDRVLAKHYGFSEEELDFIINYDIKYRMGKDAEEAEETEG